MQQCTTILQTTLSFDMIQIEISWILLECYNLYVLLITRNNSMNYSYKIGSNTTSYLRNDYPTVELGPHKLFSLAS